MNRFLVVVSCGKLKIWDRYPNVGPTPARAAYTSPVFKASCEYADHFANHWVILSAKYGFMDPDFVIPEDYNWSFYDFNAISIAELKVHVATAHLTEFNTVGVLGSDAYWSRIVRAFEGSRVNLHHVNGNVGFPPSFQRLISDLIKNNTPIPLK